MKRKMASDPGSPQPGIFINHPKRRSLMGILKTKMEADLKLRNLRPKTQAIYLNCIRDFAKFHHQSPERLGTEHVRAFLLHLREERKLSPSTQKVHVAALKFLYRVTLDRPEVVKPFFMPKVQSKVPEILSGSEVHDLFHAVEIIQYRAVLMVLYGAGLRIREACRLRIEDIDSQRMLIRIRDGKGGYDRYAMLGPRLLRVLRAYFRHVRPQGPWLFPGANAESPLSPESVRRVLHKATRKCGIKKKVTPHSLRHAFATHLLESGEDIRVIQVLLGHRSISSTTPYAQVSTRHIARTKSPLDRLGTPEADTLG